MPWHQGERFIRRVLGKLVEASQLIDALFLRQVWSGNEAMLQDLARDDSSGAKSTAERRHHKLKRNSTTSQTTTS